MEAVGEGVFEIHLRDKFKCPLGPERRSNLDMDVHRTPVIPAGVDREEPCFALGVGFAVVLRQRSVLAFALDTPERVSRLVLVGAPVVKAATVTFAVASAIFGSLLA